MFKRSVLVAALALTVSGAAIAQHHGHHDRHHHGHRHNWVAPLIGGLVIGSLIAGANANAQVAPMPAPVYNPPIGGGTEYYGRPIPPAYGGPVLIGTPVTPVQPVCRTVTTVQYDRNGFPFYTPVTICN